MTETQENANIKPILARIVETKQTEVVALKGRIAELTARARDRPPARDFRGALASGGNVALIAEVKRRSPGAGAIRSDLDPGVLAAQYERGGASAISVLTDRDYFGGALSDLKRARETTSLPALRKDFILDEAQVWEARSADADAVLLIVRILEDEQLVGLRVLAEELGMAALVEVHHDEELDRALESGAQIVGINNRDLRTFRTTLDVTLGLLSRVPGDRLLVSESGIRDGDDVRRLGASGVDAVLVGESLLRADAPSVAVAELAGHPRAARRHG